MRYSAVVIPLCLRAELLSIVADNLPLLGCSQRRTSSCTIAFQASEKSSIEHLTVGFPSFPCYLHFRQLAAWPGELYINRRRTSDQCSMILGRLSTPHQHRIRGFLRRTRHCAKARCILAGLQLNCGLIRKHDEKIWVGRFRPQTNQWGLAIMVIPEGDVFRLKFVIFKSFNFHFICSQILRER
jgi:hypothetical protein